MKEGGVLFVVGTPIGNLKDISLRALEILKNVKVVASEDTRHTRKLFSHYNIHTPLTSYHKYNEKEKTSYLIKCLKEGKDVALVTKAGMPGISDPGEILVKKAVEEKMKIVPVPGPTAFVLALVSSGFSTRSFCFEGFLGREKREREKKLLFLKEEKRTIVLYESCHRIGRVLSEIKEIMGDREIVLARELTKKFEEIIRGKVSEVEKILEKKNPRGEYTIVIKGISN